jgi:hypothetical protein
LPWHISLEFQMKKGRQQLVFLLQTWMALLSPWYWVWPWRLALARFPVAKVRFLEVPCGPSLIRTVPFLSGWSHLCGFDSPHFLTLPWSDLSDCKKTRMIWHSAACQGTCQRAKWLSYWGQKASRGIQREGGDSPVLLPGVGGKAKTLKSSSMAWAEFWVLSTGFLLRRGRGHAGRAGLCCW